MIAEQVRRMVGDMEMDLAASPERSIVSVLAVDTVDSTGHIAGIDPDDAQELLDRIPACQHTLEEAAGLVISYAGDGGVAVFGWPKSQEDHAESACDAAWLIQNAATTYRYTAGMDDLFNSASESIRVSSACDV